MKVLLELPDDVRSLPLEKQKEEVLRAYQALQPEKESKNRPMEPKKTQNGQGLWKKLKMIVHWI